MLTNLLIGKASASKLNKNKTKGVWLGAWKDRKDNYRFGIDFVEFIKIVGFKLFFVQPRQRYGIQVVVYICQNNIFVNFNA